MKQTTEHDFLSCISNWWIVNIGINHRSTDSDIFDTIMDLKNKFLKVFWKRILKNNKYVKSESVTNFCVQCSGINDNILSFVIMLVFFLFFEKRFYRVWFVIADIDIIAEIMGNNRQSNALSDSRGEKWQMSFRPNRILSLIVKCKMQRWVQQLKSWVTGFMDSFLEIKGNSFAMVHMSYAQWACLPSTYRNKVRTFVKKTVFLGHFVVNVGEG